MMSHSELYVVVGLGVSGYSCVRFLKSQGKRVAVTDSRPNPPLLSELRQHFPDVPVSVGGIDQALLSQASLVVLSPGLPLTAIQCKARVIGDVELFASVSTAPVIAITGTNAKSTVTTLVGEMAKAEGLRVQVGGNLGIPVLDLYMQDPDAALFVLELSSFQLETTYTLKPTVATVLNITPDHMDRYATLEAYQAAKQRVYHDCEIAVCNKDDPLTDSIVHKKYYFTLQAPAENEFGLLTIKGDSYLACGSTPLLAVKELPVLGKHHQANVLAALAIGHAYGFSMDAMLRVLRHFPGLSHRCQFVREYQGVKWYNDSKGTNVGATQAAIEGIGSEISGKLVMIAGGVGKNADFSPLTPLFSKYARHVVLIGEDAQKIQAVLNGVPYSYAESMEEAVIHCQKAAKEGDCVLLSPACASLDMFRNFEHRGDVFMALVNKL